MASTFGKKEGNNWGARERGQFHVWFWTELFMCLTLNIRNQTCNMQSCVQQWFQTHHDSGCSEWRRCQTGPPAGRHLLLFGADCRATFLLLVALMSTLFGQESLWSLQVDSDVLSLNYFTVHISAESSRLHVLMDSCEYEERLLSSGCCRHAGRFRSGVLLKGTLTRVTLPLLLISEPSEKLSD